MKPTDISGKNMRILVLADDDDVIESLDNNEADILISCGDVADMTILRAAELSRCSSIFAVKGNHDSSSQFSVPILDLHLTVRKYCGISFGGFNGSWKYKTKGHFLYEQDEVEKFLASFPPVDVFVAHNSPRHVHDREDEIHIGFDAFTGYIKRAQPRLFLHGHQHSENKTQMGETKIIGAYGYKLIVMPIQNS